MKIASIRAGHLFDISGFALSASEINTIKLLGLGADVSQFVARDFEEEVYRQTPTAQALLISLAKSPFFSDEGNAS